MSEVRITLHGRDGEVDVTEAVQVIFDALYHSLDFGSGFLDRDEIRAMRRLSDGAGWEPITYGNDPCTCGHDRTSHWSRADDRHLRCMVRASPFTPGEPCLCLRFTLAES